MFAPTWAGRTKALSLLARHPNTGAIGRDQRRRIERALRVAPQYRENAGCQSIILVVFPVFTSKRLENKAQGRRFGAPWVSGSQISLPRSGYTRRVSPKGSVR